MDCPKRTGHNKLLFADIGGKLDCCTDPTCYRTKVAAHVAKSIAEKPHLVQISTAYGAQSEGSSVLPRNKYIEIRPEKPATTDEAKRPEFKVCRFTTEAIVTDGSEVGTLRKVCANLHCPVHWVRDVRSTSRDDERWKTEREKQRREEAIANVTGLRVLAAIGDAVPVSLLKRDLLFIDLQLARFVGDARPDAIAKQHGIKRQKEGEEIGKLFAAYLRRADEGTLSRVSVELVLLLAATHANSATVLKEAAALYKVDADAIAKKVRQDFAARDKAKKAVKVEPKPAAKARKAA